MTVYSKVAGTAVLLGIAAFLLGVTNRAIAQADAQTIEICKLSSKPVIDGKADDKSWAEVQWNSDFTVLGQSDKKAPVQTRYKVAHDQYYLYFIAECFEPKTAKMKPEYGNEWNGEFVTLYVATSLHPENYYVIKTNPSAKTYRHAYQGDGTGLDIFVEVPLWDIPIRSASTRNPKSWVVEMAIPIAGFGIEAKTGNQWRVNVARRRFLSGGAEDSTATPLQGDAIGRPEKFNKAVVKQFDASAFGFTIHEPKISIRKKAGKLNCSIDFLVDNATKHPTVANGQMVLTSEGRTVRRKSVMEKVAAASSKPMSVTFPMKEQGSFVLMLELSSVKANKAPLKYLFRKVQLEYSPIRISLLAPAYRNNIYASQNLKEIVAEIIVEEDLKPIPVVVELSGPGKYSVSKKVDLSKTNIVKLNASELKNGKYELVAKFASGQMKGEGDNVSIRKLPPLKGEVWLDANDITYVDGKKFMPFGWYNALIEADLARKIMVCSRQFQSIDHAKQVLNEAQANNVKLIIEPSQEYDRSWKKVVFNVKSGVCKGRMSQKQKEWIKKFVNAVKDHPALFGWYLVDEPEIYNTTPSWYQDLYALMQEIDPYHPAIITNCSERGIRNHYSSCDILMPDYYPNFITGREPLYPFGLISRRIKIAAGYKATWFVPQAFCSVANSRPELNPRAPKFHELRSQIYQVFANNGKGIQMWDFNALSQLYYPLRMGPAYLDAELTAIQDELLAPNIEDGLSISTTPEAKSFQAALKKSNDDYCIIAVNTTGKPVQVRFDLKPKNITRIYVMGMNQAVDIESGSFTDTFAPYESKVYVTSRAKAQKTNLPEFMAKLDAAEKERFKPNNIVAVGAKTMKELRDLHQPDVNKAPVLTASSMHRAYFYYVWGGHPLYCLLDGITDLNMRWTGWNPMHNDASPWVNVQFREDTINRVKLYTYKEKGKAPAIEDCKVYVKKDGKMVLVGEVKGNDKTEIDVSFDPVKASDVRIVIGKGKVSNYYKGYTLSEIEVYKSN